MATVNQVISAVEALTDEQCETLFRAWAKLNMSETNLQPANRLLAKMLGVEESLLDRPQLAYVSGNALGRGRLAVLEAEVAAMQPI